MGRMSSHDEGTLSREYGGEMTYQKLVTAKSIES